MSKMPSIVISDASCLIVLEKIDALYLLQRLYGKVLITPEILSEFDCPIPEWIEVRSAQYKSHISLLEMHIDRGEASALALALEIGDCVVIIDDLKARKVADTLNVKITGTIGLIIASKRKGIIPSIKPILSSIKATNFRLSIEMENEALRLAEEI